ncbi:hypothetical protein GCM10010168_61400 [Actinoplanes ianthinogenes]|uniref:Uncharacterized protein n=1 Tax=Actinoplanes ianthinogenes TaxID=122358 RepID=A0ABN6CN00_9ACTN|nr:hypothetical protein [Actinoplanes ianthinogenes]BCJ46501.1 hypothetical protein Aiant_71580 [Actinoplanes ianthinogenes]GGR34677.1 hypothetical protein GCM10010168_61400 [Actinoplanes ianthinogenes]
MNKLMRTVAMSGLAVAAGLAIGAGPAAASTGSAATPQPSAKASATEKAPAKSWSRDRIVGFYRSPMTCHRIGRIGEWRDQWEDHDCIPIRRGFHRGDWMLKVYYGWAGPGGFHDRDHRGPGGFDDHRGPGGFDDHDGPGHGPWKKN